jgi:formamidopyrimidine-DNA glycosylase
VCFLFPGDDTDRSRDEVLYKARLHPEQYSNSFSDEQMDRLHDAIVDVIDTAIASNAEKDKFPKDCEIIF